MARLKLTRIVRREVRKPLGTLIEGDRESCLLRLKSQIRRDKPLKVILVGDSVSTDATTHSIPADVRIVDNREKRRTARPFQFDYDHLFRVKNEAGYIEDDVWQIIRNALGAKNSLIVVDGEEDLVTLPCILEAPKGAFVVYGQPGRGLTLVRVTTAKKKEIKRLIELMSVES